MTDVARVFNPYIFRLNKTWVENPCYKDLDRMPQELTARQRRIHAAMLAIILLFAASVRIVGLSHNSLWFDECATLDIVRTPWPGLLHQVMGSENTPPGYYIFLKAFCEVFGTSEIALRLPSGAGGGCVDLVSLSPVCLLHRSQEGLIAAALMSASRFHIWYSQESAHVHVHADAGAWSATSSWRMLDEPPKWKRELRYWIATVLLLYSHIYAVFVLAAQAIYYTSRYLGHDKPAIKPPRLAQLQLAIWIPFAMWFPVLWHWYKARSRGILDSRRHAGEHRAILFGLSARSQAPTLFVVAALVILGAMRREMRRGLALFLSLLLLPVVVPVIVSMLTHPLYTPRYGIVALAGIFALAACGIAAAKIGTADHRSASGRCDADRADSAG